MSSQISASFYPQAIHGILTHVRAPMMPHVRPKNPATSATRRHVCHSQHVTTVA